MDKLSDKFWNRWYEADELRRVDIVKELEIHRTFVSEHATATLVNSFLVDLAEYLEKRLKEVGNEGS